MPNGFRPCLLAESISITVTDLFLVAITTRTREKVATVLQKHGLGLGLTVPELRDLYPAKAVRRTAILEALNDLEAMGDVEWSAERVCWVGPLDVVEAFGEPIERIRRDRSLAPMERVLRAASLSNALISEGGA